MDFEADGDEVGHGKFEIYNFRFEESKAEILEEFFHFGIGEGLGEEGMAQKCAVISIAGKVLELWVTDDDCARNGLAGLRIDYGLEGGAGLGGDEFGEGEAGGFGEWVEGFEPTGGNRGLDGGF